MSPCNEGQNANIIITSLEYFYIKRLVIHNQNNDPRLNFAHFQCHWSLTHAISQSSVSCDKLYKLYNFSRWCCCYNGQIFSASPNAGLCGVWLSFKYFIPPALCQMQQASNKCVKFLCGLVYSVYCMEVTAAV